MGACSPDEEDSNILELVLGVEQEQRCMELCAGNYSCSLYTWYNASETLSNTCFLMRLVAVFNNL